MKIYIYLKMTCVILLAIILLPTSSFAKEKATYNTLTVDIAACIFSRLDIEVTSQKIRLIAPFQEEYPDMVTIPGSHPKCHSDGMSETRVFIRKSGTQGTSQTTELSFLIHPDKRWKKKDNGYVWETYISRLGILHEPLFLMAESYESNAGTGKIYMTGEDWNTASIFTAIDEALQKQKESRSGLKPLYEGSDKFEPEYYDWQFIYALEDIVSSGDLETAHLKIKVNSKDDLQVLAINENLYVIPKETMSAINNPDITMNGTAILPDKEDSRWNLDLSKFLDINAYRPGRILNVKAINGDSRQNIRKSLVNQKWPNMVEVKQKGRVKSFWIDFDYIYFINQSR